MVDPDDNEEAGVVIGGPTQFLPDDQVTPGSAKVPCDICGTLVWLSPETQKLLADAKDRDLSMKVVCIFELAWLQATETFSPDNFTSSPERMLEVMELERAYRLSHDDPLVQGG